MCVCVYIHLCNKVSAKVWLVVRPAAQVSARLSLFYRDQAMLTTAIFNWELLAKLRQVCNNRFHRLTREGNSTFVIMWNWTFVHSRVLRGRRKRSRRKARNSFHRIKKKTCLLFMHVEASHCFHDSKGHRGVLTMPTRRQIKHSLINILFAK